MSPYPYILNDYYLAPPTFTIILKKNISIFHDEKRVQKQIHSGMERCLVEEIVDPQAQSFGPIGAGNIVSRKNQKDTHVCETFHLVSLTIWANIVYSSPSTKVSMIQALR